MVGSGIRDPEKTYSGSRIPDPGGKKVPDPGSATLQESTGRTGKADRTGRTELFPVGYS